MVLMLATATVTLFMPARVGGAFLEHFGFIHLFSFFTFFNILMAWRAIRQGNLKVHRAYMLGLYIGGLLIAGGFALMPGRLLNEWLLMMF
ncbi:MAG: DUF2306 domain-containing protein [Pontibacterium sp.]